MMDTDLTGLLQSWPHDPDDDGKNIRRVTGSDGRVRLLVRVRCGLYQWEVEGRPDGEHPHGFASLLDYYRHRIEEHRNDPEGAEAIHLEQDAIEAISQELIDYYQRRVLFFRLGEYERARADAEHNLELMDILRDHAEDPEAAIEHEQWRPFVTMDRARAEALIGCQQSDYVGAIRTLDHGIEEIVHFFHQHRRDDLIDESQELHVLRDLKYQLREAYGIPLTSREMLEGLREEQAKAIEEEDFERAARLRDEIARFESHPDVEAT
ncbi:UvrB/UvrC motif-containing protein [bacterium]|nr:UvrB/UvrC motif-containing protein [bacterium]